LPRFNKINKQMSKVLIFLFHRDLRLVDHYGLEAAAKVAAKTGAQILPVFIFTPEQVTEKNPLKSDPSVQFMLQSLKELSTELRQEHTRLILLFGETVKMIASLTEGLATKGGEVVGLAETKDYTPYAKKREAALRAWCSEVSAQYITAHDLYLTEPGSIRTSTNKVFQKFTPYYEAARLVRIPHPRGLATTGATASWFRPSPQAYPHEITIAAATKKFLPHGLRSDHSSTLAVKGGRAEGLALLRALPLNYDEIRDHPAQKTSMLSAHNHFGTISIREVYWAARAASATRMEGFIRQLFWRDFHGALMDNFEELYGKDPYEFEGKASLRGKTDEVARRRFAAWKKGETGHPLVDAGIKQLLATGYMHNRVRLVVASYLVKDCHVYWRWGERFFAQHLVDYDPAQNMMNWINVSSLAPFGMAPFRRHDPEASAKRLDPENEYIDRWI
jgi:deoxyribodipyrimidine photo-lyase